LLFVEDNTAWVNELTLAGTCCSPLEDEVPLGIEFLYAVIFTVRDIEIPLTVERNVTGIVEFSLFAFFSVLAEYKQELPVSGELLDSVVVRIDYPKEALRIEVHTSAAAEFSGIDTFLAEFHHEMTLSIKFMDAVQGDISYENISSRVESEASRICQLTHLLLKQASLSLTKTYQPLPLFGEFFYLIEARISYVDVKCFIGCNSARFSELKRPKSFLEIHLESCVHNPSPHDHKDLLN
jgi:hypothetical protein